MVGIKSGPLHSPFFPQFVRSKPYREGCVGREESKVQESRQVRSSPADCPPSRTDRLRLASSLLERTDELFHESISSVRFCFCDEEGEDRSHVLRSMRLTTFVPRVMQGLAPARPAVQRLGGDLGGF